MANKVDNEDGTRDASAKQADDVRVSSVVYIARGFETLVACLMLGFVFVSGVQFMVYLFIGLASDVGLTGGGSGSGSDFFRPLAGLCSIPYFTIGLSSTMSILCMFVKDTWNGFAITKSLLSGRRVWHASSVINEWIVFAVSFGVPFFVMCVTLLLKKENWWKITTIAWSISTLSSCVLFGGTILYFDVAGAFDMIICHDAVDQSSPWYQKLKQILLLNQTHHLAGREHIYHLEGVRVGDEANDKITTRSVSLYSRMTTLLSVVSPNLFLKLDSPKIVHDVAEGQDKIHSISSETWDLSLSKLSRRDPGTGALKHIQILSSVACSATTVLLKILVLVSILVWFNVGVFVIACLVIAVLLYSMQTLRRLRAVVKYHGTIRSLYLEMKDNDNDGNKEDEDCDDNIARHYYTVYEVEKAYWITRPSPMLCWVLLLMELLILFVFPFIMNFAINNSAIGFVYLLMSIVSLIRRHFDASVILKEFGQNAVPIYESTRSKDVKTPTAIAQDVEASEVSVDDTLALTDAEHLKRRWRAEQRLDLVINGMGGKSYRYFASFYSGLGFILLVLLIWGVLRGAEYSGRSWAGVHSARGFEYPVNDDLAYTTCQLREGLEVPGGKNTALIDFAYLTTIPFLPLEDIQDRLDTWFGPGAASFRKDLVDEFLSVSGSSNSIKYHFIEFEERPGYGVITIKGTSGDNPWDAIASLQLWSAALCFQMLRYALPLGDIFNSAIEILIAIAAGLESNGIQKISYYTQVNHFIEFLRENYQYNDIVITGFSLGGGTAMISGAQMGVPAISISGPNSMLSRSSFSPKVKMEDINQFAFNVIPNRDPFAHIDDPGLQFQEIECHAPSNSLLGCHSVDRTLCELTYKCGSNGRPAICECIDFNYPFPRSTADGNTEAEANEAFKKACLQ